LLILCKAEEEEEDVGKELDDLQHTNTTCFHFPAFAPEKHPLMHLHMARNICTVITHNRR
jgi:hypothetical protein